MILRAASLTGSSMIAMLSAITKNIALHIRDVSALIRRYLALSALDLGLGLYRYANESLAFRLIGIIASLATTSPITAMTTDHSTHRRLLFGWAFWSVPMTLLCRVGILWKILATLALALRNVSDLISETSLTRLSWLSG